MEQDLYAAGYAAGLKESQSHSVNMLSEFYGQRHRELREAFDNGYQRAKLEVSDILCEVSNFLDNYTDAEYIDGSVNNRAISLKASVDALIG